MRRALILVLLFLPTLVLGGWALLLSHAEATGPSMRVAIRGFDPRDLLRGHYLMFQIDLDGTGREPGVMAPDASCLEPGADPLRPRAVPARPGCPFRLDRPDQGFQYYMDPEGALRMERLLRQGDAPTVTVILHPDGRGGARFSGIRVEQETPPPSAN